MAKVIFIVDGQQKETEGQPGERMLDVAWKLELDETHGVGACGGNCNCATCHVIVEEGEFPPAKALEEDKLDEVPVLEEHSRLACQLLIEPTHERIVVRLP